MPTMKLTTEEEEKENKISFLDINVSKEKDKFPSKYTGNQQQQTLLLQTTAVIPMNIN
jgi:ABC-type histidine transport system ATPase subunit